MHSSIDIDNLGTAVQMRTHSSQGVRPQSEQKLLNPYNQGQYPSMIAYSRVNNATQHQHLPFQMTQGLQTRQNIGRSVRMSQPSFQLSQIPAEFSNSFTNSHQQMSFVNPTGAVFNSISQSMMNTSATANQAYPQSPIGFQLNHGNQQTLVSSFANLQVNDINLPLNEQISNRYTSSPSRTSQGVHRNLYKEFITPQCSQGGEDKVYNENYDHEQDSRMENKEQPNSESQTQKIEQNSQSFTSESYTARDGVDSARYKFGRKQQLKNSDEVILNNIDKDTAQQILFDATGISSAKFDYLHKKQSISYLIIISILVLTFTNKQFAQAFIQEYHGKIINGRQLDCKQTLSQTAVRGSRVVGKRQNNYIGTKLDEINETNDFEEDVDNLSITERALIINQLQQKQINNNDTTTNIEGINQIQYNPLQTQQENDSKKQMIAESDQKFKKDIFQQSLQTDIQTQKFNAKKSFQMPVNEVLVNQQIPVNQSFYNSSGYTTQRLPNSVPLYNQVEFQLMQQQYALNPQNSGTQMMYPSSGLDQNSGAFIPQTHHHFTNQMQFQSPIQINQTQNDQIRMMQLAEPQVQLEQEPLVHAKSMVEQSKRLSDQSIPIDTSAAFGYVGSTNGLMIQKTPSQKAELISRNESSKVISSIDISQDEEVQIFQAPDQVSGSSSNRGSFHQQVFNTSRNIMVTSTTQSDSDQSRNIPQQFQQSHLFQSPQSKPIQTARGYHHNSSFELYRNATGAETPLSHSSQRNLNSNLSAQYLHSANSLNIQRPNIQQMNNGQSAGHFRHFSHNMQPFVNNMPVNFQPNKQQLFYQTQQLQNNNYLHNTMMPGYGPHFQSQKSSQSDMNELSFYGMPMHLTFAQHSSSNSSFDINNSLNNTSGLKNMKKSSKQYKNKIQKTNNNDPSEQSQNSTCNEIDIDKILNGDDLRTSVMVKNIPNKYRQQDFIMEINQNHNGRYDFIYLPIDCNNDANFGYAFVNFTHALFVVPFYQEFQNRTWPKSKSNKICEIRYGNYQGLQALKNHFKDSKVMNDRDETRKPRIFEQNIQKDMNEELRDIIEKYKITTPLEKFNSQKTQIPQPNFGANQFSAYQTNPTQNWGVQTQGNQNSQLRISEAFIPTNISVGSGLKCDHATLESINNGGNSSTD